MVHCPAYTRDTTVIGKENALSNAAAKAAVHQRAVKIMAVPSDESSQPSVNNPRKLYRSDVTNEEKEQWRKWESVEDEYEQQGGNLSY